MNTVIAIVSLIPLKFFIWIESFSFREKQRQNVKNLSCHWGIESKTPALATKQPTTFKTFALCLYNNLI